MSQPQHTQRTQPTQPSVDTIEATCNECRYTGTLRALSLHSCYVQEQGGRCEDYPCCGHTDGDGCQILPEHTSAYYLDNMNNPAVISQLYEPGSPEWYDAMERFEQEEEEE